MTGGRFCIDNNLVENAVCPLSIGSKHYLLCGNHDACIRAAIIYSLIGSCRALDVNPRDWTEDVLLRIPSNDNNRDALKELLPDRWAKSNYLQLATSCTNLEKLEINCTSRL